MCSGLTISRAAKSAINAVGSGAELASVVAISKNFSIEAGARPPASKVMPNCEK